jgi:hypothetical protein
MQFAVIGDENFKGMFAFSVAQSDTHEDSISFFEFGEHV